jgi:hypothetical protein
MKSFIDNGNEQYNDIIIKYCIIFHDKATELYNEKVQQHLVQEGVRKEDLRRYARLVHACAVYTVTYTEASSFGRKFTGLSFCWKICSQELNHMKSEAQKLKSGQSRLDLCVDSEKMAAFYRFRKNG